MKVVLQRVKKASVTVDSLMVGEIGKGILVFVGFTNSDTKQVVDKMIDKISKLRIFSDEFDKINLSLMDVSGGLLVVSQFTLMANCKKGNRPSFVEAGSPEVANELFNYFVNKASEIVGEVSSGVFGADMDVSLVNDGPFTLTLEMVD